MAETKHILILANSKRPGGYCVAGKLVTLLENGRVRVSPQWIRLVDPQNPQGGVPYGSTICEGNKVIKPLDVVEVTLQGPCNNPDHPEDNFFDPSQRWRIVRKVAKGVLPQIVDNPAAIWHDGSAADAVAAGFVRTIKPSPFSICLIPAPLKMDFSYYKKHYRDLNTGQDKTKYVRNLSFHHGGHYHEFSVTDPEFLNRHNFWNLMTETPQLRKIPETPGYFLCLSLGLAFNARHYKIGATIFEP